MLVCIHDNPPTDENPFSEIVTNLPDEVARAYKLKKESKKRPHLRFHWLAGICLILIPGILQYLREKETICMFNTLCQRHPAFFKSQGTFRMWTAPENIKPFCPHFPSSVEILKAIRYCHNINILLKQWRYVFAKRMLGCMPSRIRAPPSNRQTHEPPLSFPCMCILHVGSWLKPNCWIGFQVNIFSPLLALCSLLLFVSLLIIST